MKILGRDPVFWTTLVAVAVQFLAAWGVNLDEPQQAGINAVATLGLGVIVAWVVARDQVVALAGGLLGAVLQLFVSFGFDLSQERIASAGALLTVVLAGWLRTQVTAPIAADGSRVPRESVSH